MELMARVIGATAWLHLPILLYCCLTHSYLSHRLTFNGYSNRGYCMPKKMVRELSPVLATCTYPAEHIHNVTY